MIVKQYIKEFEKMGLGMFVHFGIYSVLESGEWAKTAGKFTEEEYYSAIEKFNPVDDWAEQLVKAAKGAGCRYITLTTRHHDGFSLYDVKGLNEFDTVHSCGRDLVAEFVEACRKEDIIPFFYHTLLDWHEPSYKNNFKEYLKYLRASIEVLCKNYGEIGGLWFDGMWDKSDEDWEEDALYGTIRKYQPEAMIINNTGLQERGKLGHIELDSVTFERGKPQPINLSDSPKYIASEMCETMGDHWGYAKDDLNYKSPATIIEEAADCRRYGANMLLNIGPKGDGTLRTIDKAVLEMLGYWMSYYGEAMHAPRPTDIEIEGKTKDFVLQDGDTYYLFCYDLPMSFDENVALHTDGFYEDKFHFSPKVKEIKWMDNGENVSFEQNADELIIHTIPFHYGRNLVVRVAKIQC